LAALSSALKSRWSAERIVNETSPLVSIIISSFNRKDFIAKTIDSVLSQSYSQIEVVVVDGGSKDGTQKILSGYGDKLNWISEPDRGEADAYNKGLRLCHGDIVAFLPSDDVLQSGTVGIAVQEFENSGPEVAMVNGDAFLIDTSDHIIGFVRGLALTSEYLRNVDAERVIQASTFLKKQAVEQAGAWDPAVRYASDLDLWIRILAQSSCRYVQAPLASVRDHPGSFTVSRFRKVILNNFQIRRKHGGALWCPATFRQLKLLVKHTLSGRRLARR
jgi:glycosyltransferase involved in cell wall biosynthesis